MKSRSVALAGVAWSAAWFGPSLASNEVAEDAQSFRPAFGKYDTAPVDAGQIVRTVTATGALNASVEVEVGSQLSGQVERVPVDFNETVVKGEILAQLDPRSYRAQYDAAKFALAAANAQVAIGEAKLKRAQADAEQSGDQNLVMTARVDAARIAAESAMRAAKRKTLLSGSGIVSTADAQDTASRSGVALAAVREAEATLVSQHDAAEAAKADCKRAEAELDVARAEVGRLEATVQSAEIDLERTRIRSPIDGVVVGRLVSEGQTLASTLEAKTLFVVAADLHKMEVYTRVDESEIAAIEPGEAATFEVAAFPHRQFEATVKQVRKAPVVIQNVVTYVVVLTVENRDLSLLPGMTAIARIETARAVAQRSVPLAALRFRPMDGDGKRLPALAGASVWVLRGGVPLRVNVKLGAQDDRQAAVTDGDLRPGDLVVTGERKGNGRQPGDG
jgi:HlyD family secretion protein